MVSVPHRSLYLKAHLYGNGTTKDLWAGIAKATGKDIEKMMSNWTGKIGFPVLTVVEEGDVLKITQNRFLASGNPTVSQSVTYSKLGLCVSYKIFVDSDDLRGSN